MTMPFLSGMLSAWVIAQLGLGVFFVLAFILARRQAEYLPFGLLCFALAVTTSGMAWGYAIVAPVDWVLPRTLAHAGAVVAAAANLHFVLRYAGVVVPRPFVPALYAIAVALVATLVSGSWFTAEEVAVQRGVVLGSGVRHVVVGPTVLALAGYAITAFQVAASQWLLVRAYRSGKPESLYSCLGGLFVFVAALNDIALVTGTFTNTVYLLPHAFMLYATGVATTLLFRFKLAAGELEQVESTLRETTEELRHSHAELEVLQDELSTKEQLAAVGELAAAIAHEVRNPLAIIVNAIASLRRQGLREEDRQMLLGIVDEETARLNRLVDDLLRFARPVKVQRASVTLGELAQRALATPGREKVTLVVEDEAPGQIAGDANLLRIAIDNLVDNALHAVTNGGGVELVLSAGSLDGAACARIAVRDTGHGMDSSVLTRATDPFFTTRPSGTGLGLPIVQRITEAHGGRMAIESEPGRGTTVSLVFPVQPAEAPVSEAERRIA